MFVRMNRFVVKLSQQEIRNAKFSGQFKKFTEKLAGRSFWKQHGVFTPLQLRRMRAVEFSAELVILLVEGPQDKKAAVDLYYGKYENAVPFAREVEGLLDRYLAWLRDAIPNLGQTRYRRPTDLYAIIGALELLSKKGKRLDRIDKKAAGRALRRLEAHMVADEPTGRAARYLAAASRQTDNLTPRMTRIEILAQTLSEA
jgi:hypothetical protein